MGEPSDSVLERRLDNQRVVLMHLLVMLRKKFQQEEYEWLMHLLEAHDE